MKKLTTFLFCLIATSCSQIPTGETSSGAGAQRAFYPDRYTPSVGDLILSLPVGYYESAPNRLNFAKQILETGTPRPAEHQEVYLRISADGSAPTRHFFALDSRHLLIFSERLDVYGDHPPHLEVFKRIGDATWKEVTEELISPTIKNPLRVDFDPKGKTFTVVSSDKRTETFRWNGSRITSIPTS
jgi:hypothetical protein